MALQGNWFDGKTSVSIKVELTIDSAGEVCVINMNDQSIDGQSIIEQAPFAAIRVSSRVGSIARYLYFPSGAKFETQQHALVDQWLGDYRPSVKHSLAHQLETHTYFVALTLILVVTFTWAMIMYGLPEASRYIAFHLPHSVMNRAATKTLQLLDKTQLKPSRLDKAKQTELLKYFSPAIAQNKNLHINVIFRRGGAIGANAFALPDGTILFTDEIVLLSKNNDELLAVLAHEIGHVKYRHSLRAVIQGSVLSFGIAMITGDLSAASNLLASLPVVITNMSYSRNFEREADDNALRFLDANHIERHYFVDLMDRLTYHAECSHLLKGGELEKELIDEKSKWFSSESVSSKVVNGTKSTISIPSSKPKKTTPTKTDDYGFIPWSEIDAHREQCDKLIANHKQGFFDAKVKGYFSSHPETKERTLRFKH